MLLMLKKSQYCIKLQLMVCYWNFIISSLQTSISLNLTLLFRNLETWTWNLGTNDKTIILDTNLEPWLWTEMIMWWPSLSHGSFVYMFWAPRFSKRSQIGPPTGLSFWHGRLPAGSGRCLSLETPLPWHATIYINTQHSGCGIITIGSSLCFYSC